ncbi:MAG: N-acetylneuraminate synthase [Lachnospiraceae bacterium]|nr:N-acetylneuraminate synthase [Lachnospiraceae bacterium]
MSVYIIAEAGVNHNGSFEMACRMAAAAKAAGADCVKYQTFRAESLVSRNAGLAEYQRRNVADRSQEEMLQRLELDGESFRKLKEYCDHIGITFLSTPFDLESIVFLDELGVPFWKIPSGEVTDLPYLEKIARTGRPVVMSTGMCDIAEIRAALETLKKNGSTDIRLLHCNTEYPTPFEDVNLQAMLTMQKEFSCEIGYSDHTKGIEVPIAAVAMGATVIEKHFTLDRSLEGPDHKASLEPDELERMVRSIRNIEQAMGDGKKRPSDSEYKNRTVARKSIVAKCPIRAGELLTEDNLTAKRPGTGISPMRWYEVLGTAAVRDFDEDELIET